MTNANATILRPLTDRQTEAQTFLTALFEPALGTVEGAFCLMHGRRGADGRIPGRSFKHLWFDLSLDGTKNAAWEAIRLSDEGHEVYVACQVHAVGTVTRRQATALALTALWADIDFLEKPSATKSYPTQDDAENYLASMEPAPSALIYTGGGIHAFWFLNQALPAQSFAELPTRFQLYLQFGLMGELDPTGNLAASMRVPGTFNQKQARTHSVDVRLAHFNPERRYSLDDLKDFVDAAPSKIRPQRAQSATVASPSATGPKVSAAPASLSPEELVIIGKLGKIPRFNLLYKGEDAAVLQRYSTLNHADMGLCGYFARYTKDATQIERLVGSSKRARNKWWSRPDYRQRTIRKAINRQLELEAEGAARKMAIKDYFTNLGWLSVLTPQAAKVYTLLVDLEFYPGGPVFRGYRYYADQLAISKNTLPRALRELRDHGLITFEPGSPNPFKAKATECCRILPIPPCPSPTIGHEPDYPQEQGHIYTQGEGGGEYTLSESEKVCEGLPEQCVSLPETVGFLATKVGVAC